ncbi:ABC transporter substrate-binding protein [Sedimentibacter sp.]|uniref:ABC transporter substrate-binding protein n=1 Tax=Sedimentibacter sp. TaxID=1960295 RepID=UPI0028AB3353|nr:ABC transporter substrate-binding protein [Sedimentibacter sp.]
MKKFMGFIVSAVLLVGLLAGCAKAPEETNNIPVSESPAPETETNTDINTESEWPRTYVDALGREVVIEQKPEKPVMIFFRNLEHLFVMDEPPVAGTEVVDVYNGWEVFKPYAETHEVIDLGSMSAVNIERLLEVEPDLILVYSGTYEKVGEQLEKIAPTIAVNNYGDDWQTPLVEYGKIFGKEDKAQEEIHKLKVQLKEGAEKLASYSDKTFAFLSMESSKEFTVYVLDFVYNKEAGLGLNAPGDYLDKGRTTISLEGIAEFNPDYLFIYNNALNDMDESYIEELSNNSVWNSLEAVKNNNVHLIDRSAFSGGPLSISYGIDAILEALK